MAHPVPPQVEMALQQLTQALNAVEKREVDLGKVSWPELEKSVVKLLGGAFSIERPDHQAIALGLSGVLGQRLSAEHQAFWFLNRESPEGAGLGFPEALMMLSPFGAIVDALSRAQLGKIDDLAKEVRSSLAQVKFSGAGAQRLGPEDDPRFFDPGFVQLAILDAAKAKTAWESPVDKLRRDLQDAFTRATTLPKEVRQQLEEQLIGALSRLEGTKPLVDQMDRAPRVVELMGSLFATRASTGSAPEEFWAEIVFPALHIGVPQQFPPVDDEELEAYKQGADVLAIYADVVPYQTAASDEGLLGVFPPNELKLPHPKFGQVPSLRMIEVNASGVKPLLQSFDGAKLKDSLQRFKAHLAAAAKSTPAEQPSPLVDATIALLTDLKNGLAQPGENQLCIRRMTEAEASSEQALSAVRQALNAPRIILA